MKTFYIFLLLLILSSCSTQKFYIVRHAEKADSSKDPVLSDAGNERAAALEKYLADKKIDTVFTTSYKRSIQTGGPTALKLNIPLVQLNQGPLTELDKLTTRLKNIKGNKNLLLVGHTNTVPAIVLALSGKTIAGIPETAYNNMYIVTIKGKKKVLVHTTYGK